MPGFAAWALPTAIEFVPFGDKHITQSLANSHAEGVGFNSRRHRHRILKTERRRVAPFVHSFVYRGLEVSRAIFVSAVAIEFDSFASAFA